MASVEELLGAVGEMDEFAHGRSNGMSFANYS